MQVKLNGREMGSGSGPAPPCSLKPANNTLAEKTLVSYYANVGGEGAHLGRE